MEGRKEEELKNLRVAYARKEEEMEDAYELVKKLEKALDEERQKISEM
jgi:predicted  nucleic acid-binding Zn-ribbon protein